MIKFDKFFEYIKDNDITQYQLYAKHKISKNILHKMRNNQSVTTYTLSKILDSLDENVKLDDICEYVREDTKKK